MFAYIFRVTPVIMSSVFSVSGGWSAWTLSGGCSVTCGGGTQGLVRDCNNPTPIGYGMECTGESTSSETCNTNYCECKKWNTYEEHI